MLLAILLAQPAYGDEIRLYFSECETVESTDDKDEPMFTSERLEEVTKACEKAWLEFGEDETIEFIEFIEEKEASPSKVS